MNLKRPNLNSMAAGLLVAFCFFPAVFPAFGLQPVASNQGEKGPRDTDAAELLLLLGKQIREIRANQMDYIAEEVQRQEEYDQKGKLKRQRELISNYYRVKLNGRVELLAECREVVRVDGQPVGDGKRLQELLLAEDKSANEQIHKIMDQSKKYNLGADRSTNQPFGGLRFADSDRHAHTLYYIDPPVSSPPAEINLHFREIDEATMFRYNGPFSKGAMPAEGHFSIESESRLFVGYDVIIRDKNGMPWSRLVARYNRKRDGKLLPVSFEEYTYHKNGQIKTHSISEYRNYRHFTVDTKIIHFESIE